MILGQLLTDKKINYRVSKDVNNDSFVTSRITPDTLGISIGTAWIFKAKFINRFMGRLVNIHFSKLPEGRGGAGLSWQILQNKKSACVTIHFVNPGIDTGDILHYKDFIYPASCRKPEQRLKINIKKGIGLLNEFLEKVKKQAQFNPIKQLERLSTYWPRLSTEIHGFIDWNWPLKDIELFVRAFDEPYKGASTFINNKRVYLKNCFSDFDKRHFHPFQNGIVYRKQPDALFVATEDGGLVIKEIKNEHGIDLINEIKPGDRFYTPLKFLEKAKQYRAFYTHRGLKK
jgi:methionyl-tRNA formyltransferase